MCRIYSDLNFGVTFLEHSVYTYRPIKISCCKPPNEASKS